MKKILGLFLLLFLVACLEPKKVGIDELRAYKTQVQACMNAQNVEDLVAIIPSDKVICNGREAMGCYANGKINIRRNVGVNVLKHELVHFYCDKKYNYGNDRYHRCVDPRDNYSFYLKCAGLIIPEEVK